MVKTTTLSVNFESRPNLSKNWINVSLCSNQPNYRNLIEFVFFFKSVKARLINVYVLFFMSREFLKSFCLKEFSYLYYRNHTISFILVLV